MDNKIAGLYVGLVKALNRLEEAGEYLELEHINGLNGQVWWDPEQEAWRLGQA